MSRSKSSRSDVCSSPKCHKNFVKIYEDIFSGDLSRISAAYKYKNLAIPSKLFRFRPISVRTLVELERGHVYMTSVNKLDDPLDTNFLQRSVPSEVTVAATELGFDLNGFRQSTFEQNHKDMRISCFTERKDNFCMWKYYANERNGLCFEYDLTRIKDGNDYRLRCLFPVIFESHLEQCDMEPFDNSNELLEAVGLVFDINNPAHKKIWHEAANGFALRTYKRAEWVWLEEWRLINSPFGYEIEPDESFSNWMRRVQMQIKKQTIEDNYADFSDLISIVYLGDKLNDIEAAKVCEIASKKKIEVQKLCVDNGKIEFI